MASPTKAQLLARLSAERDENEYLRGIISALLDITDVPAAGSMRDNLRRLDCITGRLAFARGYLRSMLRGDEARGYLVIGLRELPSTVGYMADYEFAIPAEAGKQAA